MNDKPRSTDRPCEDCGAVVVVGLEPIGPGDDPELEADGLAEVGSEWCTNLECPSNRLGGLLRVGVNDYVCQVCDETLRTPIRLVFAHVRAHRRTPSPRSD